MVSDVLNNIDICGDFVNIGIILFIFSEVLIEAECVCIHCTTTKHIFGGGHNQFLETDMLPASQSRSLLMSIFLGGITPFSRKKSQNIRTERRGERAERETDTPS